MERTAFFRDVLPASHIWSRFKECGFWGYINALRRWLANKRRIPKFIALQRQARLTQDYQGVGKLLPELKLSWYENMLAKRHEGRIWKPFIKQVFPNSTENTVSTIRNTLKNGCDIIRKQRNRIAHHEPIFNQPTLTQLLPLIEEAVSWRCKKTVAWLRAQEKATELLNNPIF